MAYIFTWHLATFSGGMVVKITGTNKNYMSIAVSVLITKIPARNNCGATRQESSPQSANAYNLERSRQV